MMCVSAGSEEAAILSTFERSRLAAEDVPWWVRLGEASSSRASY